MSFGKGGSETAISSKWLGDFIQADEFEDVRDFKYPSSLSEACLASVQDLQVRKLEYLAVFLI